MCDLRLLTSHHGIEVAQESRKIKVSQKSCALKILELNDMLEFNLAHTLLESRCKFGKEESHSKMSPTMCQSLVENHKYLTYTRLDLMFLVRYLGRYIENLTIEHMDIANRISRYVTLAWPMKKEKKA